MSSDLALGLSEKQQAIRLTGVGASEVPDVVLAGGITTYARKVGEAEPFEGTSLTEFGLRGERILGEAWMDRHAAEGVRIYTPGTLRHRRHEWALASPDRVVASPGSGRPAREDWISLLEMKWVFFSGGEYGEGADDVPERHLVQVQWQLEVADLAEATLVACVNGDYREYPIRRDRELGELLIAEVGRFWRENVLARVPPPVDGSAAYTAYLRRRHPRDQGPLLPPTQASRDLVAKLREARAALRAAEEAEGAAANALKAYIGDAAGIEQFCTWKTNRPSEVIAWEGIARNLAVGQEERFRAQVQTHTTTKPGARVLRLLLAKE